MDEKFESLTPSDTIEPLTPPDNVVGNNALLMKKIADGASLDGLNVDGEDLVKQAKLFVVAQACNELNRVIKLTNYLDTLEAKFMSAVDNKLADSPENLQLLTFAMEAVTNSLNRSNTLITQVLKDEKLASIVINTTNVITQEGNSATIMDMNSRDAVRNMASSLLAQLGHIGEIDESNNEVIDVKGVAENESKT